MICRARRAKEAQVAPTSSLHVTRAVEDLPGAGFVSKTPPKHPPVTLSFLPTGVYILAGKPPSPNPSQKGESLSTNATAEV